MAFDLGQLTALGQQLGEGCGHRPLRRRAPAAHPIRTNRVLAVPALTQYCS